MGLFRRKKRGDVVNGESRTQLNAVKQRLDKVEKRVNILETTVQVYKREV